MIPIGLCILIVLYFVVRHFDNLSLYGQISSLERENRRLYLQNSELHRLLAAERRTGGLFDEIEDFLRSERESQEKEA